MPSSVLDDEGESIVMKYDSSQENRFRQTSRLVAADFARCRERGRDQLSAFNGSYAARCEIEGAPKAASRAGLEPACASPMPTTSRRCNPAKERSALQSAGSDYRTARGDR